MGSVFDRKVVLTWQIWLLVKSPYKLIKLGNFQMSITSSKISFGTQFKAHIGANHAARHLHLKKFEKEQNKKKSRRVCCVVQYENIYGYRTMYRMYSCIYSCTCKLSESRTSEVPPRYGVSLPDAPTRCEHTTQGTVPGHPLRRAFLSCALLPFANWLRSPHAVSFLHRRF